MRKKIVAGNWKMHKRVEEARHLVRAILNTDVNADKVQVIIFPPALFLTDLNTIEKEGYAFGAQNCYAKKEGAFTGEISAYMLQSVGIRYCLVGHSERRKYFHETDADCLEKVQALLEQQMTPVLCVGEELEQRESGHHFDHVKKQVLHVLKELSPAAAGNLMIAYEPVWAIGTGKTASTEQASEMHTFIRQLIHEHVDAIVASRVHILYGGSVKDTNARELMQAKDIDGVLVGGASLETTSFSKIIAAAG